MRYKYFRWPDNLEGRRTLIHGALYDAQVFRWILKYFQACPGGYQYTHGKTLRQAWAECEYPGFMHWWLTKLQDYEAADVVNMVDTRKDENDAREIVRTLFPGRLRKQNTEYEKVRCALYRNRFTPTGTLR